MATRPRVLRPIVRAQRRRSILPWYFDLSGKGLFLLVALGVSLLALLALAQTGRVVTANYQVRELQRQEQNLLWERETLLARLSRIEDPANLERWARANGMEPLAPGEVLFLTVPLDTASAEAASDPATRP